MRPCSQFHRERGSLLPGSAPECTRWLFWDRPRPWPARIEKLAEVELWGPDIKRLGAKLLFSHATQARVRAWEWRAGQARGGTFESLEQALAFFETEGAAPAPELFAVCSHGSRDTCCGRYGPGVAAALARAGADVIEVSHPGGHRFAPTTLAFPEFRCYGNLSPEEVPAFLERQRAGIYQPEHYRGPLWLGKAGQVAEAAVWRVSGRSPRDARVAHLEGDLVQLETAAGSFEVRLEATSFQGPASCGEEDGEMLEQRVLSVTQS